VDLFRERIFGAFCQESRQISGQVTVQDGREQDRAEEGFERARPQHRRRLRHPTSNIFL
jgi:hypothetical protein